MIVENGAIFLGKGENKQNILLKYANRHGLIAGATGTGKTVSLQGIAEGFSAAGVPVFMADIKGDLGGLSQTGEVRDVFAKRAVEIGFTPEYQAFPTIFWDIFAVSGHPIRTTISEMGPLILSQLLQLNDTQEGVINIAFAVADAEGLLLLDMDDLRAMLTHLSENAANYSAQYGNIAAASVASIQRAILTLEQQGGKNLFGEPAIEISSFMKIAPNGYGALNILCADKLMQSPKLYASFMLWLMSELFEDLPEVGDLEKPKLVFFFDEAHLLFSSAPKALVEKIEQLVKLIRSKGVGVYFITQNPADIPEGVLSQLGNRIQHALRAYTPQEIKAAKAAAQSFRANPKFKTDVAITELAIGEALVSTLDIKGTPTIVERTLMRPPLSKVGAIDEENRKKLIAQSPFAGVYEQVLNRESAYEMLTKRVETPRSQSSASLWGGVRETISETVSVATGAGTRTGNYSTPKSTASRGRQPEGFGTALAKSVVRAAGSQIGRQVVRGIMKSMLK